MKAVILDEAHNYSVQTVPVPTPGPGQVLVKVEASPINPSDVLFLKGYYPTQKPFPCTPGFEGSGTVVEIGEGLEQFDLLNKRVSLVAGFDSPYGCWSEYTLVEAKLVIKLNDDVTFEQGSSFFINPVTVLMFMEFIEQGRHRSVVQNAAASALGKMLLRCCLNANIPIINVVRRQEQVDDLKSLGATYVLNSSSESYETELRALTEQLHTTIAFDAIGGSATGVLFKALKPKGTLYVYGALSGEPSSGLSAESLIFHQKKVEGAWLTPWLASKGTFAIVSIFSQVGLLLGSNLKTDIQKSFNLDHLNEAVEHYARNMSGGKVLIKPSQLE